MNICKGNDNLNNENNIDVNQATQQRSTTIIRIQER